MHNQATSVNCVRYPALTLTALLALLAMTLPASAGAITLSGSEHSQYLLIGMGPVNNQGGQPGVGQAVNMNNFELGANKAPVPSTSSFLNSGSGPSLLGNVPNIPLNAMPVASGVTYDGNIAITHAGGVFNLQNVGVYADHGVRTAGSLPGANAGTSNSFYNDPNMFPNTFTSTGFTKPGVNHNTGGFGLKVNPSSALQSTRMDASNYAGITPNYNFSPLLAEIADIRSTVPGLAATSTINLAGKGGKITTHTTINLLPGLNIIDILTGGNDFLLEKSNLVIDGPAGSAAIFRIPNNANMLISNGNILVGNSGIDLTSVMFFSNKQDNNTHFNFSNAILNGVAFWSVANRGSAINISNAQGCTQLVADKITLNDTRFMRCAFTPEPGTAMLLGLALFGAVSRRRPRHRREP